MDKCMYTMDKYMWLLCGLHICTNVIKTYIGYWICDIHAMASMMSMQIYAMAS